MKKWCTPVIREFQQRDLWHCTFIVWRALGFKCARSAYNDFKNPDLRRGVFEKLYVYIASHGKPIGICGLYRPQEFPNGSISLHWFAVHPFWQRSGIGSHLLEHSENQAVNSGFNTLVVECNASLNRFAHTFYKHKGFKISRNKIWKIWQDFPDCEVLEKTLSHQPTTTKTN